MNLFDRFTRAIERNSRDNERRNLVAELDQLFIDRDYIEHRIPQAIERLVTLREADWADTYGKPAAPKRPIIEIIEDDATPARRKSMLISCSLAAIRGSRAGTASDKTKRAIRPAKSSLPLLPLFQERRMPNDPRRNCGRL